LQYQFVSALFPVAFETYKTYLTTISVISDQLASAFTMKKLFSLIVLFALINSVQSQVYHFSFDGLNRQYRLHMPDVLSADAPLVFVLHGYSGSAISIKGYSDMDQVADDNGFAVCYPQGTTDQWHSSFWNVGYSFHQSETVDDVGFLTALAQYLQGEYGLNSQNTFCTGMSNGGDMCYLLACQASDIFKAIAPVAGCMMEWIYSSCTPADTIPVFEIHGTDDDITWWDGDMEDTQGYGPYLDVMTSFDFWVQLNNCAGCTQPIIIDTMPDLDPSDGSIVISHKDTAGIDHNQVWLYEVLGGGHDWPGSSGNMDIVASEEIWNFFSLALIDDTPLAVELISFTAASQNGHVTLNWITGSELEAEAFHLDRSEDGQYFTQIAEIKGQESSSQNNYEFIDQDVIPGKSYYYRLADRDYDGNIDNHQIISITVENLSMRFRLYQNYPNPFNPVTHINYDLPKSADVTLTVYDLEGRAVQSLVSAFQKKGSYTINFDASGLSSGVYVYQFKGDNDFVETRKMLLLK
jgi:polyhydroxybutyrate depolymerase